MGPHVFMFSSGQKNKSDSSGKKSRSKSRRETVRKRQKGRKLQVQFTVCTSASSLFACFKLWVMMRGLWCWKWAELKLYNELFHLNQVQSHLLIRSGPHTISGYFWSLWLVECTAFKLKTWKLCSTAQNQSSMEMSLDPWERGRLSNHFIQCLYWTQGNLEFIVEEEKIQIKRENDDNEVTASNSNNLTYWCK